MNPFSAHTAEIRRLVALFNSTTLHFAHVADRVDESKLGNVWLNAVAEPISLDAMIRDYGRHLGLHLGEIEELINCNNCDC